MDFYARQLESAVNQTPINTLQDVPVATVLLERTTMTYTWISMARLEFTYVWMNKAGKISLVRHL